MKFLLDYLLPIVIIFTFYQAFYHLLVQVNFSTWKMHITRLEAHLRIFYSFLIGCCISMGIVFGEYEPITLVIFGITGALLALSLIYHIRRRHKNHQASYHYFFYLMGVSMFYSIPIGQLTTNILKLVNWI